MPTNTINSFYAYKHNQFIACMQTQSLFLDCICMTTECPGVSLYSLWRALVFCDKLFLNFGAYAYSSSVTYANKGCFCYWMRQQGSHVCFRQLMADFLWDDRRIVDCIVIIMHWSQCRFCNMHASSGGFRFVAWGGGREFKGTPKILRGHLI